MSTATAATLINNGMAGTQVATRPRNTMLQGQQATQWEPWPPSDARPIDTECMLMVRLSEQYSRARDKRTACGRTQLHSTPQTHWHHVEHAHDAAYQRTLRAMLCTETPGIDVVYT